MLKDKKIILGVAGSIAAYKSVFLLRELKKLGADVHVIMTRNAGEFVAELTLKTLSGNRVFVDMFKAENTDISHVNLQEEADLFVVAPATANIIGKFASGIADDFLSTFFLAVNAPVLIAPSMNCNMYNHKIVQDNINKLTGLGCGFIGPETGELACRQEDIGRLSEVDAIVERICDILTEDSLTGKKVLVTAGPTVEGIDPVRFLSNRSTGRMGYALAKMARRSGADVTLISGPVSINPPGGVEVVSVLSAAEMHASVMERFKESDILIMAAACADFTIGDYSERKIKKDKKLNISIELTKTADILSEVSKVKGDKIVVGFAAESENIEENALNKLRDKKLDFIVANDITAPGTGFAGDTNIATIIDSHEKAVHYEIMTKEALAEEIIDKVARLLNAK